MSPLFLGLLCLRVKTGAAYYSSIVRDRQVSEGLLLLCENMRQRVCRFQTEEDDPDFTCWWRQNISGPVCRIYGREQNVPPPRLGKPSTGSSEEIFMEQT